MQPCSAKFKHLLDKIDKILPFVCISTNQKLSIALFSDARKLIWRSATNGLGYDKFGGPKSSASFEVTKPVKKSSA